MNAPGRVDCMACRVEAKCPICGATFNEPCTNPLTGKARHVPHIMRLDTRDAL